MCVYSYRWIRNNYILLQILFIAAIIYSLFSSRTGLPTKLYATFDALVSAVDLVNKFEYIYSDKICT